MDNINYNDFNNICRICLFNGDLKSIQQDIIIEILHKLGVPFETNDELPQQICLKCIEKINKIQEFVLQCNETYSSLVKSLNNFKSSRLKQETNEPIKTEEEITTEEHKIELIKNELEIKEEVIEEPNEDIIPDSTNSENIDAKLNETQNKDYKCDICNKTFIYEASCRKHKRIHSSERPYKCTLCSTAFLRLFSLTSHMRSHSSERPFKCDVCLKTFKFTSNLVRHKRIHTGERPYTCEICNKRFIDPSNLRTHMVVHRGERIVKCNICSKTFKSSSVLKLHKKIHRSERLFECNKCAKPFKYSRVLVVPQDKRSGGRPFKCDVCKEGFIVSKIKIQK